MLTPVYWLVVLLAGFCRDYWMVPKWEDEEWPLNLCGSAYGGTSSNFNSRGLLVLGGGMQSTAFYSCISFVMPLPIKSQLNLPESIHIYVLVWKPVRRIIYSVILTSKAAS